MKNVILINGSPKVNSKEAVSKLLLDMVQNKICDNETNIAFMDIRQSIKEKKTDQDFKIMLMADALVFAFPLYVFCIPGILMRYIEDYYNFYMQSQSNKVSPKVYAIVNCGFPEPDINLEAVRVIKSFCSHINAKFRFGALIGGGGMLLGAKDAPFMKKTMKELNQAFSAIEKDIKSTEIETIDNFSIKMNFPRRLYMFAGDKGWIMTAKKNGLEKKDIYRKPYNAE